MNDYKLVKNTEWKEVEINGEIEEIPIEWKTQSINNSMTFNMGSTPKKETDNYSGDLPWITISNLYEKYICNYTAKIKKTKNIRIFPKGSLLISFKMSVGKAGFTTEDSAINEAIMGFQQKNITNNINYLYFCLPSVFINNAMPNGQGLLLLNQEKIKHLEYIEPPISQQTAIADILSAQESIVQDIESLILKYQSRFQYLSEELLSGRIRVKEVDGQLTLYKNADDNWKEVEVNGEMIEIPKDWKISKVFDIFDIQRGKVLSKDYIQSNLGNYPVYSSATENNGSIGNINSYMFDGEYLTWTTDGVYAGTVFYRNGKFNCTNICGVLKDKTQNSLKGLFYFIKNELPKHVNHIGNSKLMSNAVSDISFIYPETKEQFRIAKLLTQQEDLLNQQKELLSKEKQKFDWLLDNLLSGKYLIKEN